jgi:hypothetical protein
MLIVDDILTAPFKGLIWLCREIHEAAEQEQAGEADRLTAQLSELYMRLETGQITEAEFDTREKELLDRLDQIQQQTTIKEAAVRPQPQKKKARRKKRTKMAGLRRKRSGVPLAAHP